MSKDKITCKCQSAEACREIKEYIKERLINLQNQYDCVLSQSGFSKVEIKSQIGQFGHIQSIIDRCHEAEKEDKTNFSNCPDCGFSIYLHSSNENQAVYLCVQCGKKRIKNPTAEKEDEVSEKDIDNYIVNDVKNHIEDNKDESL